MPVLPMRTVMHCEWVCDIIIYCLSHTWSNVTLTNTSPSFPDFSLAASVQYQRGRRCQELVRHKGIAAISISDSPPLQESKNDAYQTKHQRRHVNTNSSQFPKSSQIDGG